MWRWQDLTICVAFRSQASNFLKGALMPLEEARNAKDELWDTQSRGLGRTRGWNEKQEKHRRPVSSPRARVSILWNMLTFDFWHRMVAAAGALAESGGLCSGELAWVCERQAMAMAMAKVTVCDVARRMENAMGTLRPSFRRYVVNA